MQVREYDVPIAGKTYFMPVVIYGVFWDNWGWAKLNFSNLIKDLMTLKTLTYKKH